MTEAHVLFEHPLELKSNLETHLLQLSKGRRRVVDPGG